MAESSLYSLDNEVFRVYLTYAVVLVLKMFFIAFYTSFVRITKKVYANKEDFGIGYPEEKAKERISKGNDRVERVRRCHLNDLENIPVFLVIGLLYVAINPVASTAILHYRIFTAARFIHNVAYLLPLPQPCRALGFTTGVLVTASMGIQILRAAAQF
ncbi:microsomal glutathione S-transferase 1-like [Apostichopus japonicus]|uniref:microsomal glutathione S-transferase 1-like n=1 Tax=Stichopus japonicus TaxID=307972 RepID=UPI003AB6AC7D